MAAADPETVLESLSVGRKDATRRDGNAMMVHCTCCEFGCVQIVLEFDPQHEATPRPRNADIPRKVTKNSAAEPLKLFGKESANSSQMRIVSAMFQKFSD